mgnify:CR=1 FL=1
MYTTLALLTLLATPSAEPAVEPPRDAIPSPGIFWTLGHDPKRAYIYDWLEEQGWCWGIEMQPDTPENALRMLSERGFALLVHLLAHPETAERHWTRKGETAYDVQPVLNRFRGAVDGTVYAEYLLEDDSAGVAFSEIFLRTPPKDRAEAFAMWNNYLDVAMAHAVKAPGVEAWGVCGYAPTAHSYAAHGVDCVIVERANDDVEDLQSAVAFARGAARQYGVRWGIDLSLWWGPIYGCVHDLPASLYKRHLYLSHFSGSQVYRIEGGDILLPAAGQVTRVAQAIEAFAERVRDMDVGAPEVPVAVMLEPDHGWMTPPYWRTTNELWNYARLPYEPGDRGIDGFFGAAFPGSIYAMDAFPFGAYEKDDPPASPYSLSCITPEFAPTPETEYYAEPPMPFGRFESRAESRETLYANNTDPSPYRAMGDSRWGDIFDVLTTDADADVLKQYPVLVLLGRVELGKTLPGKLRAYVESGGVLVVAAGVAGPQHAGLCGADMTPELRTGRAWRWRGADAVHEAFRYVPAEPMEGAEVLAEAPGGMPLAIAYPLGKGRVYTCLVPWYESGHTPLSGVALRLFDEAFGAVQPVTVEGLPVEWCSAKGDGHRTVVVANHDLAPWSGRVTVRALDATLDTCVDIVTGRPAAFTRDASGAATVALEIPAYDVRVLRWQRDGGP